MLFALSTLLCVILLSGMLLAVWFRHDPKERKFLIPAIVLLIIYIIIDQLLYSFPEHAHIFISLRLYTQILLCPACLLFSNAFARATSVKDFSRTDIYLFIFSLLTFVLTLLLPTSAFYYQTDFTVEPVIFLEQTSFYLYLYIIVMYVISIGHLESTLRNSQHSEQWRIKIALLGLGFGFACLMIFASQGLLYKIIDIRNVPLRNAGVVIGCLLVLYSELKRNSNEVYISRKIVFRSLVAVIAGLYFIGIGVVREGSRVFGSSFTQSVIIVSAVIIFSVAISILLSQSLRRKFTIWVQRNFYDEKYDYRAQWMQFSEHLARSSDYNSFIDAAIMSFCNTFGRIGAIYIPVDTEYPNSMGQSFYYEIDKNTEVELSDEIFLQLLKCNPSPILVDTADTSILQPQTIITLLTMQIGIVLPIRAADMPEGLLLLGHPMNGNEKYDIEDFELMEAMGNQLGLSARSFRVSEEMALNREIQAFDKLGTFVLHDLKNQVYALSLLTNNARNFISDPEFQVDMVETLSNTVGHMKILISQLAHLPKADALRLESVYLQDLAKKAASQIPNAPITISGTNPLLTIDSDQMSKVFLNLYLNALEAGDNKPIEVVIEEENGIPAFHIIDQAGGLAPEIIEAGVFKPFNTTKPRGMGIGLYHSRKIVEAHGATITAHNRPNDGCTFTVKFEMNSDK